MEIIKRNLISVICGLVAVVAVVVGLLPLNNLFEDLNTKLRGRLGDHQRAQALLRQPRFLPYVNPDRAEVERLAKFPSAAIIASGREMTRITQDQAGQMMQLVLDMNDPINSHPTPDRAAGSGRKRHGLLYPGALPAATDTARERFRDMYDAMVRNYPAAGHPGAPRTSGEPGQLIQALNAGVPASADELQAYIKRREAEIDQQVSSGALAKPKGDQLKQAIPALAPLELRRENSQRFSMYIAPEGLVYSSKIRDAKLANRLPDNEYDIWWAQVGLWIQQDVVQAIVDTHNRVRRSPGQSITVPQAVIKNLLQLQIPEEYVSDKGRLGMTTGGGGGDMGFGGPPGMPPPARPGAASPQPSGPVDPTAAFRVSPSGRVSNDLYDVVHFNLRFHADWRRLPLFLAELSRERLISILEMQITNVDRAALAAGGFYYGEDPLVEVRLRCEVLFLRDWTRKLMPAEVKRLLGIPL